MTTPQILSGLEHFADVHSRFLPHDHDVVVCLPPGYHADQDRHYPVLYLHDGQNVFDDYPMAPFGVQWGVDTTARALMHAGFVENLILVAVGNAGRDRIDEYTPTRDAHHDAGGLADRYGQMLVYEIKPMIDKHYRTLRGATNTGLAGSSLGGLLTLHLGLTHPAVFGKLGVLSPSVWWDDRWIVRQLVSAGGQRPTLRIWLDVGTGEKRMLKGARLLYRMLVRQGWRPGIDLEYVEAAGALHEERAWADRTGPFLQFLLSGALNAQGFVMAAKKSANKTTTSKKPVGRTAKPAVKKVAKKTRTAKSAKSAKGAKVSGTSKATTGNGKLASPLLGGFTGFRPNALTFLRGLKKNNRKEWFEAHRSDFENDIKQPMIALIEEMDVRLATIAPEIIGSPKRSMFRIHRDVRFSKDKSPYKTHAAAWFFHRDAGREVGGEAAHGGAGFYFHVAPEGTFCGGGVWMPPRHALARIRQSLADDYKGFEDIVLAPAFKKRFGAMDDEGKLTRVPRGFAPDHPAGDWLRFQSFTAGCQVSTDEVLSVKLPDVLAKHYAAMAPLVRWLNAASGLKVATAR